MRKLILWLEIAITIVVFAGVAFATTMLAIGIDGLLSAPWQHWTLCIGLVVLYALFFHAAIDQISTSVQLYSIARHKARRESLVGHRRQQAHSAMRDFRNEAQAWQNAAERSK